MAVIVMTVVKARRMPHLAIREICYSGVLDLTFLLLIFQRLCWKISSPGAGVQHVRAPSLSDIHVDDVRE